MTTIGESVLTWDEAIKNAWFEEINDAFLESIWEVSIEELGGLEVQVVIDGNNKLHISKGTPSFVDFKINPIGMKLPIKCWIHTHPFGLAYWSGIDWRTINTWAPIMERAIVLGNDERGHWFQGEGLNWVWERVSTGKKVNYWNYRSEEE